MSHDPQVQNICFAVSTKQRKKSFLELLLWFYVSLSLRITESLKQEKHKNDLLERRRYSKNKNSFNQSLYFRTSAVQERA